MVSLALLVSLGISGPGQDLVAIERVRLQRHLSHVEQRLRERDSSHLAPELRRARAENLDRLAQYWRAGQFPTNTEFARRRVPYFVDDGSRACAVAHLVIESGARALAEEIRRVENNARLGDMRTPALARWVAASGLTTAELAAIQPSYCNCDHELAPVCGTDGITYANACAATKCAGVDVAHEGPCTGDSDSGWPPAGSSSDSGSAEDTGSTGPDASTTSDTGSSSEEGPPDEPSAPPREEDEAMVAARGCGCRHAGGVDAVWLSLLIAGRRRRR